MSFYGLTVALVLSFLTLSFGQERGGVDPRVALPLLTSIMATANTSGSLEYWGRCESHKPYPDFPRLRRLSNYSGSPAKVLQEVFASDPKMKVWQEPNGLIRMLETDVPIDLLNVKIRHISFGPSDQRPEMMGGPNSAMHLLLSAPEVKAFRKSHNIGPFAERWTGPGDSASKVRVSGELYNVTISEALDYILQTFPGFWIYENCRNDGEGAGRQAFIAFFETSPNAAGAPVGEAK